MLEQKENRSVASRDDARLVNKPTGTVHIANCFSFIERKLINCLIWHAQLASKQIIDAKRTIPVSEVFRNIGLGRSNNTTLLKTSLKHLVTTAIEWNIFGQDRAQEWGVCTFLSVARITRGQLTYTLNPEVVSQIKHPRVFSQIRLLVQANFKSKYSLILYEFCLDHLCRMRVDAIDLEAVPVEQLYKLCGVYASYKDGDRYRAFNQKVLKKAVTEINDKSDLDVELHSVREKRRIVALNIAICRKQKIALVAISQDENKRLDLYHRLAAYGIEEKVIHSLFCKFERKHIKRNLDYVEGRARSDTILHMASYIVSAVKKNYAGDKAIVFQKPARKDPVVPMTTSIKVEDSKQHIKAAQHYFESQPEDWRYNEIRQFEAELIDSGNDLMLAQYRKKGMVSAMVAANFYQRYYAELS